MERSSGAAPPRHSGASDLLSLAGELDLSTIPKLERPLMAELESRAAVIADLTRLSFIDSSGSGLLIQAFRRSEDEPKLHTVIAEGSQVERVFRLAGIDRAIPLYLTRERALAAASPSA